VTADRITRVRATGTRTQVYEGTAYNVLRFSRDDAGLVDAARCLLLFLEALLRVLHANVDGQEPVLTIYLDADPLYRAVVSPDCKDDAREARAPRGRRR
jgi:hypothetical protein